MKLKFEQAGTVVLASCAFLVACSGGPKDEDVVLGMRAGAGLNFDSVKNLGCEKAKEGEVKDSGTFYRCRVESSIGGKTLKDTVYFQQVGEQWMFRGK